MYFLFGFSDVYAIVIFKVFKAQEAVRNLPGAHGFVFPSKSPWRATAT